MIDSNSKNIVFFYKKDGRKFRLYDNNLSSINLEDGKSGRIVPAHYQPSKTNEKKKNPLYKILPITNYVNKYGQPNIVIEKDTEMSEYLNDPKKALRDHKNNVARTYIVFDPVNPTKQIGYFTLCITCLYAPKGTSINGEVNAYDGCNIINQDYYPAVKLVMIAKDDNNSFVKMKTIFEKEIAKRIFNVFKEIGMVYVYLECSVDNHKLIDFYSQQLHFDDYPYSQDILREHGLKGMIQRIEFINRSDK